MQRPWHYIARVNRAKTMRGDEIQPVVRRALCFARVIGLVGMSAKPERASFQVAKFLTGKGYRVIGVNPGLAGQEMFGERVVATVSDLPADTDMIDIFRRSDAVEPIVDEALGALQGLRVVWMQLGVKNANARKKVEASGAVCVENRCPKIEYTGLFGDLALEDLAELSSAWPGLAARAVE